MLPRKRRSVWLGREHGWVDFRGDAFNKGVVRRMGASQQLGLLMLTPISAIEPYFVLEVSVLCLYVIINECGTVANIYLMIPL